MVVSVIQEDAQSGRLSILGVSTFWASPQLGRLLNLVVERLSNLGVSPHWVFPESTSPFRGDAQVGRLYYIGATT
jgi:hypothetical protein